MQFMLGAYQTCILQATKSLIQNWLLPIGSALLVVIFFLAATFLEGFGWGGSFLLGAIAIVLLAYYYGWISDVIKSDKLSLRTCYQLDYFLFFHIISVAFVLWIARYLVESLVNGMDLNWVPELMQFGIVVLFNAIPETLYIHRYESTHALSHAAEFTRENWIEWFIPYLIFLLPVLMISPDYALAFVAESDELMPPFVIVKAWLTGEVGSSFLPWYLSLALAIIVANWFMLFRGFLFEELESGSRRQRMFRADS